MLGTASTTEVTHSNVELPDDILNDYDNDQLLPVDAPPVPDLVSEMNTTQADNHDNSSDTVNYELEDSAINAVSTPRKSQDTELNSDAGSQMSSPRGRIQFKHYGIRRNYTSPKSKGKKFHCIYCDAVRNSKCEINDHHRKTHGNITCVDCKKTFPTPDTLQRHRYIHSTNKLTCSICGESAAFDSDLKRHMAKHNPTKKWFCVYPGCNRDFK